MINVLLVEDSQIFAMGLQMALDVRTDMRLVSHKTTSGAAVSYLNENPKVDIAILDITLEQQTDGLELLGLIRKSFPQVIPIMLSHYKTPAYIIQAITYGARAYIAKDSSPEEIANDILRAYEGNNLFFGDTIPEEEINSLFGGEDNVRHRRPQNLSPRELEVLQFVTSGYSNSQIASALGVTTATVDTYKERIKAKFGLDTIIECVASAVDTELISIR
ncbi:MAG: response regulator transcription factor [Bacteroidales bacterium]|nr:response regulator transcription factor [Bacteroidales bacterium]